MKYSIGQLFKLKYNLMKKNAILFFLIACISLFTSVCRGQGQIQSGVIHTITQIPFLNLGDITFDSAQNMYFCDDSMCVQKMTPGGILTRIIGVPHTNFTYGPQGDDGGPATAAILDGPSALTFDASGNLYIGCNNSIRKIDPSGIVTTVVGNRYSWIYTDTVGDGMPATAVSLVGEITAIICDRGNLYFTQYGASIIRKMNSSGILSTFAGHHLVASDLGDGGPATAATLNNPQGMVMDANRNIYISENTGHRLRKIDSTGIITTYAGNGVDSANGDGGPASAAELANPSLLKIDLEGNLYIVGIGGYYSLIRKISTSTGIITTAVGNGTRGYSGDGGPAALASVWAPQGMGIDAHQNLYFTDQDPGTFMRKVTFTPDIVADSFSEFIDSTCSGLHFSVLSASSSALSISTTFGDGTSDTTLLAHISSGDQYAGVDHPYNAPGTYSIKQILWKAGIAIDSAHFSFHYTLCKNIAVNFYIDGNANCIKDSSDGINYLPVLTEVDSNGVTVDTISALTSFNYSAHGNPGDIYAFKVISLPAGLTFACGGDGVVRDTLDTVSNGIKNNYLGFDCSSAPGFDLVENVTLNCGRHVASGTITIDNTYCNPVNSVVTMNIDPKYIFDYSYPAPTSVVGNTVTWNYSGLGLGSGVQVISFYLNVPGAWLAPGDTILSSINITPFPGDVDTTNNVCIRTDTVKSSYDPNEMSVIPSGFILPGTTLQYTINFENTGNDTAHNISVMDTLSDNVDVRSLRADLASAAMAITTFKAGGHNIVKFDFPKINLLDSSHHGLCNGLVIFHVKTKGTLADGATVFNHAGIIFDDNPVVVTDTVENIISLIHGPGSVCAGSQIVLSDFPAGGTSTLSNANASISADTVTGIVAGKDTLTYTVVTKYETLSATKIITVNPLPAVITGTVTVCAGSTIVLSDASAGGHWSSSATGIATVGSGTGIVAGISAGTSKITYSSSAGCLNPSAMITVTVNPLPVAIAGTRGVCLGLTTSLSDASAGGTWSSSNAAIGSIDVTGVVSGLSAGTVFISYTLPTSCLISAVVTVNPLPGAIGGATSLCMGLTTPLNDPPGSGTWSSSTPGVATIGGTGVVTGIAAGTTTITYTLPTGCIMTRVETVNAPTINGTPAVCSGLTTALTDASGGTGSWTSSSPFNATVGGTTGIVTGNSAGTAVITYNSSGGCRAYVVVTVSSMPAAISGTKVVCEGLTTSLSDVTAGGYWTNDISGHAVVGTSGIVTGVTAGTSVISYNLSTGCMKTAVVTVNAAPAALSGAGSVCIGSATSLSDLVTGGTWASGTTAVATVSTGGTVTGVASGTSAVSYTLATGCKTFMVVTVNALPVAITGTKNVCVGLTTALSDATTGGVWSADMSGNASVGSGSGIVSGLTPGTSVITYMLTTGCSKTAIVTVNAAAASITGTTVLCQGATTNLTNTVTGGTWASGSTAIATISTTGVVTGIAQGTSGITYTFPAGCKAFTVVTVNATPGAITGVKTVCAGLTTGLTDAVTGGAWSTAPLGNATVDAVFGTVTGVTSGTASITYTMPGGCNTTSVVTVNQSPSAITGVNVLCSGSSSSLSNTITGGTWSSNAAITATVSVTGVLAGNAAGAAVISYTLTNGCAATLNVTVNPLPADIMGITPLCAGSSAGLSDASTGGTWSSSNVAVGTVDFTSGLVTGIIAGTATISYQLPTTCLTTAVITINPVPSPITGVMSLCAFGGTTVLSDATPGGNWSSADEAIDAAGNVTALAPGIGTIDYTLITGCSATAVVTVNVPPTAITGVATVCSGLTTILSDAVSGGSWSADLVGNVTINSATGLATGIVAGTSAITYTLSTGCSSATIVTVNQSPTAIMGTTTLCAGSTASLSDATAGGAWSSGDVTVATISAEGAVTGVASGNTDITYTAANGCMTSDNVNIIATPPSITGLAVVCTGATSTLTDAASGGTWSTDAFSIATVGTDGVVTGISSGVANITYTAGSGCTTAKNMTVNPAPSSISGSLSLCLGSVFVYTDASTGGSWSSGDATTVAIDGSTGAASGVGLGTASITYTAAGCSASSVVTVNPTPVAIAGTLNECAGSSTALSDASAGGVWSSSSAAIATISTSGLVTGVSAGTADISYALPSGCSTSVIYTVNPLPSGITGASGVCVGSATPLAATPSGGNWMSSSPLVASIDATGLVSAITAGTTQISYILSGGCNTTLIVTVNTSPGVISGITAVCTGAYAELTDGVAGGTWNTSTPGVASIATIGASTGVVIGIAPGVDTISYTLSAGCTATTLVTVYAAPVMSVTATAAGCGGVHDLVASGADFYSWSPIGGIACGTCAANQVDPMVTTTFTVTGTGLNGCSKTETVSVNANRIIGHVVASGLATDVMKVWLMQFDPADSSLLATDSMLTCADGGMPYFEFDGVAAGHYLVQAKLLGGVPGATGYVPVYGSSSLYWNNADAVVHTNATDTQQVHMILGVVAPGTGFIGGSIVSGAGRGTSGEVPVVGMLVYLLNSGGQVVTYTYTDGAGAYSFSGLGEGIYIVYPEDYKYYTTESDLIALSSSGETVTGINFKKHTSYGTITPYNNLLVTGKNVTSGIGIYPNPTSSGFVNITWQQQLVGAASVVITDMAGREVQQSSLDMNASSGHAQIDVSKLISGVYLVTVRSGEIYFKCKLVIE